jgi:hypothetical protein
VIRKAAVEIPYQRLARGRLDSQEVPTRQPPTQVRDTRIIYASQVN